MGDHLVKIGFQAHKKHIGLFVYMLVEVYHIAFPGLYESGNRMDDAHLVWTMYEYGGLQKIGFKAPKLI